MANSSSLESFLGKAIREERLGHGLTIADVSERAGVSRGMLSKIENAQTAVSLDALYRIAATLGVSLSMLFRNFGVEGGSAQHVRKGAGMEVVRRGTKRGHTHHLLAYDQGPTRTFEPLLITIDNQSEVFPEFEHPGSEFIYMLEGRMDYRHGEQVYSLQPGDSLTFQGEVPHGPGALQKVPIRFITVIVYPHWGGTQTEEPSERAISV